MKENQNVPANDEYLYDDAPDEYLDPVTYELMEDPVVAQDGNTYERADLLACMKDGVLLSPLTRVEIDPDALIPNRALKEAIERYKKEAEQRALERSRKPAENDNNPPAPEGNGPDTYSHEELLERLRQCFNCEANEVAALTVKTMVRLCHSYCEQPDAAMERFKGSSHTNITFNFAHPNMYRNFLSHYSHGYKGSIIMPGSYEPGKPSIIMMDTKILYERIAPKLGECYKITHIFVLEKLAEKLSITYKDVFEHNIAYQRLVAKAGIYTSQKEAGSERDGNNTMLHLILKSQAESQKFIDYYQQNYPSFIVKHDGCNVRYSPKSQVAHIRVDSKVLLDVVAPTLTPELDSRFGNCHVM